MLVGDLYYLYKLIGNPGCRGSRKRVLAGGWDSRGDGLTYRPFLAPGLCHIYIDNMWMNSEGLWPNVWECEQVLFNDIDIVMKLILWPLKVDIESYLNIFNIIEN